MQVLATLVQHRLVICPNLNSNWPPTPSGNQLCKSSRAHPRHGFTSGYQCIHLITLALKRNRSKRHSHLTRALFGILSSTFVVVALHHQAARSVAAEFAALDIVLCHCRQCERGGIVHLSLLHCRSFTKRRQSLLATPLFSGCAWIHIFFDLLKSNLSTNF